MHEMAGLVKLRRSAGRTGQWPHRAVHLASALDMSGGERAFALGARSLDMPGSRPWALAACPVGQARRTAGGALRPWPLPQHAFIGQGWIPISVASSNTTVYHQGMMGLRVIFQTFLLALIVAMAANGVAMASNVAMNQDHCAHSASDAAHAPTMAMDHANHPAASGDTSPDHDHETCMMHACSAVAYEAHGAFAISVLPSAASALNEHTLVALERADSPLRPPNT